jgi:hypothetical protein
LTAIWVHDHYADAVELGSVEAAPSTEECLRAHRAADAPQVLRGVRESIKSDPTRIKVGPLGATTAF